MRVLSLFSGIGGFDIACEAAGMTVVGQVEIDPYCQKVLEKHWPGVRRLEDIFNVRGDEFGTVDLIVAGVPCQPASCAGKRRGTEDDRWLWGEALRIVRTAKPMWCVFENPTGILSLQGGIPFEDILVALEAEGYEVQPFIIPASAVGAPHQRERVFIVARMVNTDSAGLPGSGRGTEAEQDCNRQDYRLPVAASQDVAHSPIPQRQPGAGVEGEFTDGGNVAYADEQGSQRHRKLRERTGQCTLGQSSEAVNSRRLPQSRLGRDFARLSAGVDFPGWPTGPGSQQHEWEPPRIAKGVPHRRERLKALGNAVVPAQIYPILQAIAEVSQ